MEYLHFLQVMTNFTLISVRMIDVFEATASKACDQHQIIDSFKFTTFARVHICPKIDTFVSFLLNTNLYKLLLF